MTTIDPEVTAADRREAEAGLWHAFHSLVDQLTPDEALIPGYYPEGWSVRDLMAHIGAWLAESGLLLEQMHSGTYVDEELDVDAANARFAELMRDVPLDVVSLQVWASRWRLISTWSQFLIPPPAAQRWLAKGGSDHYAEHLPRLEVWVEELTARRTSDQPVASA